MRLVRLVKTWRGRGEGGSLDRNQRLWESNARVLCEKAPNGHLSQRPKGLLGGRKSKRFFEAGAADTATTSCDTAD